MRCLHVLSVFALLTATAAAQSRGLEVSDSAGTRVGTACSNVTTCAIPQITPVGTTTVHVHGAQCGAPYVVRWSTTPSPCPAVMPPGGQNLLVGPQTLASGTLNTCDFQVCNGHASFQIPATPSTIYIQAVVGGGGSFQWTDRIRIR